jgi:hypothetical protein
MKPKDMRRNLTLRGTSLGAVLALLGASSGRRVSKRLRVEPPFEPSDAVKEAQDRLDGRDAIQKADDQRARRLRRNLDLVSAGGLERRKNVKGGVR